MRLNEETRIAREALREKHKKYLFANQEKLDAIEYRRIHGTPKKNPPKVVIVGEAIPVQNKFIKVNR